MKRKRIQKVTFGVSAALVMAAMPPTMALAATTPVSAPAATSPAASSAATAPVPVPQAASPTILKEANYFGNAPGDTVMTVDIILKVQNESFLKQYIKGLYSPHSPFFHQYLSVSQFSQFFAPPKPFVQYIAQFFNSYGIKTSIAKNDLRIQATGTVNQLNQAFNVELQSASYKGKPFIAAPTAPKLPPAFANFILCVLGLTTYSNDVTNVKQIPEDKGIVKASVPAERGQPGFYTPREVIRKYNVQPLYNAGATGQGQTIGIVTLANFNRSDAYHFWNALGFKVKPNRITKYNVDGGFANYSGHTETSIDVEQSGALAPDANIRVYVGSQSDPGFYDAFSKAITQDVAKQISCSWGENETIVNYAIQQGEETPYYLNTFNQLFMEAAAQGQSLFIAAGDNGAYEDANPADIPTYNLTAGVPSDSPYATAAGGTTLPWSATFSPTLSVDVKHQRAWGWNYLYPIFQALGLPFSEYFVGGNGGYSTVYKTPWYQKNVPGVNEYTGVKLFKPYNSLSSTPPALRKTPVIVHGTASGRNLPDLAMNADPESGYMVYLSEGGHPGVDGGWQIGYGGTSFIGPQLAAMTALINDETHSDIGFWNPQIYKFATSGNSPFKPLDTPGPSNTNLFYSGTPGTLYNPATGLGVPNFAKLESDFQSEEAMRFPGLPTLPPLPTPPSLPPMPALPKLPPLSSLPSLPSLPSIPGIPGTFGTAGQ